MNKMKKLFWLDVFCWVTLTVVLLFCSCYVCSLVVASLAALYFGLQYKRIKSVFFPPKVDKVDTED